MDLRWYWGNGPQTWAGDAGLRSPIGGQLSAVEAGLVGANYTDISAIEDDQIRRATYVARARDIQARLEQLTDREVRILHAEYTGKGLPFSVSSAAAYTEAAKALCGADRKPAAERLRQAMMDCKTAANARIVAIVAETDDLVKAARGAYERTVIVRTKRLADSR